MGPAQIITDKVKLFVTYQVSKWVRLGSSSCGPQNVSVAIGVDDQWVNGGKIEINDDMWHEIYGSFRIKKRPGKVMVYIQVVYFTNSGTEANELAMLMARLYSGNLVIIALRNAYHGGSAATIRLTALNTCKYPIAHIPFFFIYLSSSYKSLLSWNFDSTLWSWGAVELAPRYLKLVYDMVRKAGGVCIADEVQTGFGRTGSHYWGFQMQDVVPDIVTWQRESELVYPQELWLLHLK
nr:alanine--glyoxylate aminotransferase 2 homolog 1, mitochondrial-like [Tanacetum cinerariifolium]